MIQSAKSFPDWASLVSEAQRILSTAETYRGYPESQKAYAMVADSYTRLAREVRQYQETAK